jgi:hypothetical protein
MAITLIRLTDGCEPSAVSVEHLMAKPTTVEVIVAGRCET